MPWIVGARTISPRRGASGADVPGRERQRLVARRPARGRPGGKRDPRVRRPSTLSVARRHGHEPGAVLVMTSRNLDEEVVAFRDHALRATVRVTKLEDRVAVGLAAVDENHLGGRVDDGTEAL